MDSVGVPANTGCGSLAPSPFASTAAVAAAGSTTSAAAEESTTAGCGSLLPSPLVSADVASAAGDKLGSSAPMPTAAAAAAAGDSTAGFDVVPLLASAFGNLNSASRRASGAICVPSVCTTSRSWTASTSRPLQLTMPSQLLSGELGAAGRPPRPSFRCAAYRFLAGRATFTRPPSVRLIRVAPRWGAAAGGNAASSLPPSAPTAHTAHRKECSPPLVRRRHRDGNACSFKSA